MTHKADRRDGGRLQARREGREGPHHALETVSCCVAALLVKYRTVCLGAQEMRCLSVKDGKMFRSFIL